MPTAAIVPEAERPANCWAAIALDLIRTVRVLRGEYRAAAELLALALDQIRALSTELDRVRARYHALLDEPRAERKGRAA